MKQGKIESFYGVTHPDGGNEILGAIIDGEEVPQDQITDAQWRAAGMVPPKETKNH